MTAAEKRAAALTHGEVIRNPETGKIIGKLFTFQQIEEAAERWHTLEAEYEQWQRDAA